MADSAKDEKTAAAGGLLSFTIQAEVERAKGHPQWSSGDRFAISLAKHRDFTLTTLVLRKGAHLKEHQARGSVSVQVLSGAIRFSAAGEDKMLTSGMICVLDKEIPHSVEALEESAILLTAALPG